MRVLFDHCTPYGIARFLVGHEVTTARKAGWAEFTNGRLLNAAEEAGFDVTVTVDQVRPAIETVVAAVNAATAGSYTEVPIPEN